MSGFFYGGGCLARRTEPFRRPTGVGSVLTVIELKRQLDVRPPHPEVKSSLWEHCPKIAHPPAVCFGCLLAWLAWLPLDCQPGLGHSNGGRQTGIRIGISVMCLSKHSNFNMNRQFPSVTMKTFKRRPTTSSLMIAVNSDSLGMDTYGVKRARTNKLTEMCRYSKVHYITSSAFSWHSMVLFGMAHIFLIIHCT